MLRQAGLRAGAGDIPAVIAALPAARGRQGLAAAVGQMMTGSITAGTRGGYTSALKRYFEFCGLHALQPFPVGVLALCGFIRWAMLFLKFGSLKVYLAAIRDAQILESGSWHLQGNELVRRAIRFVRRAHGDSVKAPKLPITLAHLVAMCKFLPGFPVPERMCHDDRAFVAASSMAITGFLRGGEFLASTSSDKTKLKRPTLMHEHVNVKDSTLFVSVPTPKTMWWLDFAIVRCFSTPSAGLLDPPTAMENYRRLSPVRLAKGTPALVLSSGKVMTRDWLVRRTLGLLRLAGIVQLGDTGLEARVLASSWRAGAVRSAIDAGISEQLIKHFGRWKSAAWEHYLLQNAGDLREALALMWGKADGSSGPARVGVPAPDLCEEEDTAFMSELSSPVSALASTPAAAPHVVTGSPETSAEPVQRKKRAASKRAAPIQRKKPTPPTAAKPTSLPSITIDGKVWKVGDMKREEYGMTKIYFVQDPLRYQIEFFAPKDKGKATYYWVDLKPT